MIARLAILHLYMEIGDMAPREHLSQLERSVGTLLSGVRTLRSKDELEKQNVKAQVDELMQAYMARVNTLYDDKVHAFDQHMHHFISLEKKEIKDMMDFCLNQLDDKSFKDRQQLLDEKIMEYLRKMEVAKDKHFKKLGEKIEQSESRIRDFEAESNARIKVELAKLNSHSSLSQNQDQL
jgi:hypothetical protein